MVLSNTSKEIALPVINDMNEEEKEQHYPVLKCPRCLSIIGRSGNYCKWCGQKLDRTKQDGQKEL